MSTVQELTVDAAAIDALQPGDVVTLRRQFPAGYWGTNQPARVSVRRLTIARLERLEDWAGEPSWCLEGCGHEMRGCWAVGRAPGGMVTTLEPVQQ